MKFELTTAVRKYWLTILMKYEIAFIHYSPFFPSLTSMMWCICLFLFTEHFNFMQTLKLAIQFSECILWCMHITHFYSKRFLCLCQKFDDLYLCEYNKKKWQFQPETSKKKALWNSSGVWSVFMVSSTWIDGHHNKNVLMKK